MSPLKDLLAAIQAEADEERARVEAESRTEAEAILAAAREEAQAVRDGILRSGEPGIRAEATRRVALANLEAARSLRLVREESYKLLVAGARSELAALREDPARYRDAMFALFGEGLAALPDADTLRVDPRDEALAANTADGLAVETAPIPLGGLVLESDDGRTLRNTFEDRLANADPDLRLWYGRRLDALAAGVEAAGVAR
ncbi:hypothetical protein GBA65_07530 [Rubrobacter marinus]|uniref:V-type ATP synthase subunit E n=1 Tax=Rubrobacter marinus TaxID=2653852 RepID=A0A6G8PW21_9ACTN|nr:V-type ATP synthase subunit E [Rubrobacter marinus]QIN78399.1 hypothetical protein GBA65_07530 [Rubrobacter marinus]